jgi:hypothetical protein
MSASSTSTGKPVSIVEFDEHHLITPHIVVQGEDGALVLIDSHDDCGAGPLDVGTWLLPAAARGCFGTVLWISAWCTNLPDADFRVSVCSAGDGTTAISYTTPPPPAWAALWGEACMPRTLMAPAQRRELRPLRIIKTNAAGGVRILELWNSGARNSPTSQQMTIDLDYFSVRNPGVRSIPFGDLPGFRRELIALAKRVPMERGAAFIEALEALVAGSDGPHEALPAVAAAAGITPASSDGERLLHLLATAEEKFQLLPGLRDLDSALQALLLVGLAEHEATTEELNILEAGVTALAAAARWISPTTIARSELYTPRRQLEDIRARARRALTAVALERE